MTAGAPRDFHGAAGRGWKIESTRGDPARPPTPSCDIRLKVFFERRADGAEGRVAANRPVFGARDQDVKEREGKSGNGESRKLKLDRSVDKADQGESR